MATQRQVRAKNAQLMHVWTALNIAGSYGKRPEPFADWPGSR